MQQKVKQIQDSTLQEILTLSRLLGEFGSIQRVTRLPNGDLESDSHHSFSLALISYELARQFAPELDAHKILLYSLVHDLPELITGDTPTLTATTEELVAKTQRDQEALSEVRRKLIDYPHILEMLETYEAKQDEESLFVFWIDKMTTIPTHFFDNGENLRRLGIANQADIQRWYATTLQKLRRDGKPPHNSAVEILELAYQKMHDELLQP
jgi:5'-deoxynucleotidase YfbR-like HD superfamily hydrolase